MALNRFYLVPFVRGQNPVTSGFATAIEAGAAAQNRLINGSLEQGTKFAVVKLVAVVEIDNPQTKSTLADDL